MALDRSIITERFVLKVVGARKHLGTMVTGTACPAQDASRRIQLPTSTYAWLSGHYLGSTRFDLAMQISSTATFVDATVLHPRELW